MPENARNTPFVLIIRDGWGENPNPDHDSFNAIHLAKTPVADRLQVEWPHVLIQTSGENVGLPDGTMGNSEVGHQNIGAGRIVDQDSGRITKVCREGLLGENKVLVGAIRHARTRGTTVHLMGLASDAGVHALLEHLYALLGLCVELGQNDVAIHLFTDGRDTGPFTGRGYIKAVEDKCAELGVGRVASIIGRYWAMDRDNRWERVERAYRCLTGRLEPWVLDDFIFPTADAAIQDYYHRPDGPAKGDEFVTPRAIGVDYIDVMTTRITDGDAVIFFNYRGDRPREICSAFLLPEFLGADEVGPSPDTGSRGFDRENKPDVNFVIMTPYSNRLATLAGVAFPKPPPMVNIAGEYLSSLGLTQFRCAETEKYPHVTFFFNDYRDTPFPGESWETIQSPRVETYDLKPEMSAAGVCDAVLARLEAKDCEDIIVVNFANGDMVGHTGDLRAAIAACETVDRCVGQIVEATLKRGGSMVITADHGNAEQMFNPKDNAPHTSHTTYDVPLIVVGEAFRDHQLRTGGRLADIMPTALDMMGITRPEEMTGRSLLP
jgi:2,3-bisphosphoglycerate-independent phosphoglycerate mutase